MGSLRQDLAPLHGLQDHNAFPTSLPYDLEDNEDDWGSDEDECMILGTTPHVNPHTISFKLPHSSKLNLMYQILNCKEGQGSCWVAIASASMNACTSGQQQSQCGMYPYCMIRVHLHVLSVVPQ